MTHIMKKLNESGLTFLLNLYSLSNLLKFRESQLGVLYYKA
jgi:hypothetical protein